VKIVQKDGAKKQKEIFFSSLQWGACFLLKAPRQVLCMKQNDLQYIELESATLGALRNPDSTVVYAVDAVVHYQPIYD
jgi:hypothetical protein